MASSTSTTSNGVNAPTIDMLLRLVPDSPDVVLTHLSTHPSLASASDTTGYSLLHAAASYNKLDLLRSLVKEYNVNINITDEEGESALFAAETLAAARCLVEELGADISATNVEDRTAEANALDNMEDGGEWPLVADYLERRRTATTRGSDNAPPIPVASNGDIGEADIVTPTAEAAEGIVGTAAGDGRAPPSLPPGVRINMGTMQEAPLEGDGAPDPEFRRRIEELAARDDFHSEEGQKELRDLVSEAIGGLASPPGARDVRRRLD